MSVMAAAALASGVAAWSVGSAHGLWSSSATIPAVTLATGHVGFAVTDPAPAGSSASGHQAAASSADELVVPFGPAEAAEVMDAGPAGVAWTFEVVMAASGNAGIDYSIEPTFKQGGIFELSDVNVFPVDDPSQCSVGSAPQNSSTNLDIPGIPQTYGVLKRMTARWCMTAVADIDPRSYGYYKNTATVTAKGPDDTEVSDTDSWDAYLLPNPADELPNGGLKVTHKVIVPQ
jgi:hypothetical protein